MDRIEMTYDAIDQMAIVDGKPKPKQFGGGTWDKNEELAVYVKQVGENYSCLQWGVILSYAKEKTFDTAPAEKEVQKFCGKDFSVEAISKKIKGEK